MAAGGDTVTIRLDRHYPAAGAAVKGGVNQGGIRFVQDSFAALSGSGGLFRVNVRMNHPEDVSWAAWEMLWAQQAGLEVLLTVYGSPEGIPLLGGGGGGQASGGGASLDRITAVPADLAGWAMSVIAMLGEIRRETGALPDYVEIWNEPDRPEFFNGSIEDYLAIYEALAPRLRAQYPQIQVGGMGLAGSESDLGTGDSALIALIDHADDEGLPLDFLSWHNYGIGASMRYTRITERLDAEMAARGMDAKMFVTEWNVRANAQRKGMDFDSSAAAANFVALISSAVGQGLDGNTYFMLFDTDDQEGIADLTGKGLGALTVRGIKKPVWRLMELTYPMAEETRFGVGLPEDEYALGVLATWDGARARIVLGNDTVEPEWVWTRGCREFGLEPGTTAELVRDAGGNLTAPPSRQALIAEELTGEQADQVLLVLDRVADAGELLEHGRTVELELDGCSAPSVLRVWRFDSSHNAPASRLADLRPHLEQVERDAVAAAEAEALVKIAELGGSAPAGLEWTGSILDLANALGLTVAETEQVLAVYFRTLKLARLSQSSFLNSLPGAALVEESAAEAGVQIDGNRLTVSLEPDSVIVLDVSP